MKNILRKLALKSVFIDFSLSFLRTRIPEKNTTGGVSDLSYAYQIFIRNLNLFLEYSNHKSLAGLSIAELGPGDSTALGHFFAAFGAASWTGYDAYPYATNQSRNIADEVLSYISGSGLESFSYTIPSLRGFTPSQPTIASSRLVQAYSPEQIQYISPYELNDFPASTYDFFYAQACCEHIEDIDLVYSKIYDSIKPNVGIFINQVDFKSHGRSLFPTGHYRYSKSLLRFINSNLTFRWISGYTPSQHTLALKNVGFTILKIIDIYPTQPNVHYDDDRAIGSRVFIAKK